MDDLEHNIIKKLFKFVKDYPKIIKKNKTKI